MKFRKKPVEVEARLCEVPEMIPTLEGHMRAKVGDWIITGIQGETYPCDQDIFRQTYDPVDDEAKELWDKI